MRVLKLLAGSAVSVKESPLRKAVSTARGLDEVAQAQYASTSGSRRPVGPHGRVADLAARERGRAGSGLDRSERKHADRRAAVRPLRRRRRWLSRGLPAARAVAAAGP